MDYYAQRHKSPHFDGWYLLGLIFLVWYLITGPLFVSTAKAQSWTHERNMDRLQQHQDQFMLQQALQNQAYQEQQQQQHYQMQQESQFQQQQLQNFAYQEEQLARQNADRLELQRQRAERERWQKQMEGERFNRPTPGNSLLEEELIHRQRDHESRLEKAKQEWEQAHQHAAELARQQQTKQVQVTIRAWEDAEKQYARCVERGPSCTESERMQLQQARTEACDQMMDQRLAFCVAVTSPQMGHEDATDACKVLEAQWAKKQSQLSKNDPFADDYKDVK